MTAAKPDASLQRLIDNFQEAQRLLIEATGGKVDAVLSLTGAVLLPAAQQQLIRSETEYRHFAEEKEAILDALPSQIALLGHDGEVVTVNKAWRDFEFATRLSGSPNFDVGTDYARACEAAPGMHSYQAAEIATGVRAVLGGASSTFSTEYACTAEGEKRWFHLLVSRLPQKNGGGAVVMHIDISERMRAEKRSLDIGQRFETLINEATIGILVHRNWKLMMANEAAARIFGYASKTELLELPDFRILYAPEEQARILAYNAARLTGGEAPEHYFIKANKRDGSSANLANHVFALDWGGEPVVCAMITDVSELLATEEQLRRSQKMEAIGQLTGGIAHDFNNILMIILSSSDEILEQEGLSREIERRVLQIGGAAERAADLTRSLLAFSRKLPLNPQRTDLNELVVNTGEMLRRTLGAHIEVNSMLAENLWPINVDRAQLESALVNLCLNARDAMPSGGRLLIETANVELGAGGAHANASVGVGSYLMLAVTDSGVGIPSALLDRIFDPFFTTKEFGKGTGLGLSMVYGFAKQSGGGIDVTSDVGIGTTMRLYLPRAMDLAEKPPQLAASFRRGSERILVVEDDPLVRGAVVIQLRSLGYTVGQAPDAMAALVEFEATAPPYDLVLTDVIMPGPLSSRELAAAATRRNPATRVLYMSGYSAEVLADGDRLKPDVHLLAKPFRKLELANAIRRRLDT